MAYKYQYNPGITDNQSLRSVKVGRSISRNGTLVRAESTNRHRRVDEDSMTTGAKCCFTFLMLITQILLHGVVGLVLYWVWMFHKGDDPNDWHPFAWRENPRLEWNMHPVLMIVGFVYCMGQAMLMYRSCRCCRRIANKLLHTVFHLLAMPCIALAFVATYDSHTNRTIPCKTGQCDDPIPNFYSLHSWMGLTTMGLFALQFVVGFFSFLLLLCCESATASFRAALVPIHSTFGITTFVMAVATACSGLTEKAFFTLSEKIKASIKEPDEYDYSEDIYYKAIGDLYTELPNEAIIINTLAAAMVALAILLPCIIKCDTFHKGLEPEAEVESDVE